MTKELQEQHTYEEWQARMAYARRVAKMRTILSPMTHMVMLSFMLQFEER